MAKILAKSYALTRLSSRALSPTITTGDGDYARLIFSQMPHPNTFSWSSMIRGLSLSENPSKEPISLFKQMLQRGHAYPNSFTLTFVLKACGVVVAFKGVLQVHSHVFQSSPFVQTGLLNFYAKCEEIGDARRVFDEIPERSLIARSAMISGYARIWMVNEGLGLFREMQKVGIRPDEVTMVSIISACAKAGAMDLGRWVHAFIEKNEIKLDFELSTALVDMHAKCRCIERARELFDVMPDRDTKA